MCSCPACVWSERSALPLLLLPPPLLSHQMLHCSHGDFGCRPVFPFRALLQHTHGCLEKPGRCCDFAGVGILQAWEQRLETEWYFHVVMSSSVLGTKGDVRVIYSLSEISPMTHSVPDRCQTAAWTATVGELLTSTAELKENRLSYVVEQFCFWPHFPLKLLVQALTSGFTQGTQNSFFSWWPLSRLV